MGNSNKALNQENLKSDYVPVTPQPNTSYFGNVEVLRNKFVEHKMILSKE